MNLRNHESLHVCAGDTSCSQCEDQQCTQPSNITCEIGEPRRSIRGTSSRTEAYLRELLVIGLLSERPLQRRLGSSASLKFNDGLNEDKLDRQDGMRYRQEHVRYQQPTGAAEVSSRSRWYAS